MITRYRFYLFLFTTLIICQSVQSAMMLKTSTRIKGKELNLFIMPIVINGSEKNQQIEIASTTNGGQYFIKIDDFFAVLGFDSQEQNNQFVVTTAIGKTFILKEDCHIINHHWAINIENLADKLAMDITVNQATFAIHVDAVWLNNSDVPIEGLVKPKGQARTVDYTPSNNSLSYVRSEYFYRQDDDNSSEFSQTEMGGRLFSGVWQLKARNYIGGDPYFEDYLWVQTMQNRRLLVGNQVLSLNPLLESTDFTGAQIAWSNKGIEPFLQHIQPNQLINDANGSVRSFNGIGIAGGKVELRIEGLVIAETFSRIDNSFEFQDIEIPAGGYIRIEAWVFQPNQTSIPHRILDLSRYNSNQNLASGTWLVQAGLGVDGNLVESPNGGLNNASYLRSQYSLNDHMTIDSIFQSIDGRDVGLLATRGYWGKLGYWEIETARANSDQAWRFETQNQTKNWFFRGGAQHKPDYWLNSNQTEYKDSFAEFGIKRDHLQISLVHRKQLFNDVNINYTLPAVSWRPTARFAFQARPDFNGDYVFRSNWKINARQQFNGFSSQTENAVNWGYQVNRRQSFNLEHLNRVAGGFRSSAIYRSSSSRLRSVGWSAGILAGEKHLGFLAHIDYEFIPGLKIRAQILRDPILVEQGSSPDTVFGFNMIAAFNVGSGYLSRGQYYQPLNNTGSVSGRISTHETNTEYSFLGLWVMINGQRRAKTETGGQFTIPNLSPGIYEVKLDLDGLLFELTPSKDLFWVEVAAGSNSHVEFKMTLNLGISGKLRDRNNDLITSQSFTVKNASGAVSSQGKTNSFGQFRVEGLRPGTYQLITESQQCGSFELDTTHLTHQNLKVNNNTQCEVTYEKNN